MALVRGMGAMMSGDRRKSQLMMRYRVGFQLATVCAFVGGVFYKAGQEEALRLAAEQRGEIAVVAVRAAEEGGNEGGGERSSQLR